MQVVSNVIRYSARCPLKSSSSSLNKLPVGRRRHQNFSSGGFIGRVKDIYSTWRKTSRSVASAWKSFFKTMGVNKDIFKDPMSNNFFDDDYGRSGNGNRLYRGDGGSMMNDSEVDQILLVHRLIRSYQMRGHHVAQLDPLKLKKHFERWPSGATGKSALFRHYAREHAELVKKVEHDVPMDKQFKLPVTTRIGGDEDYLTLAEIMTRLEQIYCHNLGLEYMHISSFDQCDFVRKKFETPNSAYMSNDQKRLLLSRLGRAVQFEHFFASQYQKSKRFGLEGCEVLIPCLKTIIDKSTDFGVDHFLMGMTHRGRMNVLANILRVPLVHIMSLYNKLEPTDPTTGDVQYHMGVHIERVNRVTNKRVRLTMISNPSHLECVNAVVMGRTKAEQFFRRDHKGTKIMSIMIHGDSAFAGQGMAYEVMNLADLESFSTHGTIHVVINNQIGFTTEPLHSRSQPYSSDVGKVINAPIFHVNADNPEAVMHIAAVAAEWRFRYKMDCVIELIAYRRHGHHELDDPSYTQPIMYATIGQTPNVFQKYSTKLNQEGVTDENEVKGYQAKYNRLLERGQAEAAKEKYLDTSIWNDAPKMSHKNLNIKLTPTGIPEKDILELGKICSSPPPPGDFQVHKMILKTLNRRHVLLGRKQIDWSLAEAIAISSLLKTGTHVRLSGLEVERGTFCNRHYVLHHQSVDGATYRLLDHIDPNQAVFSVYNSALSELSVLGFEVGYSQCNPNSLIIWEAQFGDFADIAQCIIDQFISSGEAKWAKQTGIVVNLPHGLDAAEPDHSSCRPERYLQMCNDDQGVPEFDFEKQLFNTNWSITAVTTAANLFHVYRRQVLRPYRKPLINLTPKSILELPIANSKFDDIKDGTSLQRVIPDTIADPKITKKVVFSCGRVYYDFLNARREFNKHKEIALIRIEQPAPFPYDLLQIEIDKYPHAKFVFGQEEPKNMGFHQYCVPRLKHLLGERPIKIVSRPPAAATASGYPSVYRSQLTQLKKDVILA